MTQPQIELLPCPNPSPHTSSPGLNEHSGRVECYICGMAGPAKYHSGDAIDGWNALPRPSPAVAPGLRDLRTLLADESFSDPVQVKYNDGTAFERYGLTGQVIDRIAAIDAAMKSASTGEAKERGDNDR